MAEERTGRLRPIFVGYTPEGHDKVVLYHKEGTKDLYLLRPDGEIRQMPYGSKVSSWGDNSNSMYHVAIQSEVWTGTAQGSKRDLIEEPTR